MDNKKHQYLKAIKVRRRYEDNLLLKKGVVGCGVGLYKQGSIAIVVYISGEPHGIPPELDDVNLFTEEIHPNEEWTKEGHITAASIQNLNKVARKELIVNPHL